MLAEDQAGFRQEFTPTVLIRHVLPQGAPGVVSKVSMGVAKLEPVTSVQQEEVLSNVGRRWWRMGCGAGTQSLGQPGHEAQWLWVTHKGKAPGLLNLDLRKC